MKFFSTKYRELIVTVDPKMAVIESGIRMTKGMNNLFPQGLSIAFKNREFDTKSLRMNIGDEMKLIKVLKKHPSYGVSFVAEDTKLDEEDVVKENKRNASDKDLAAAKAAETDPNADKE